MTRNWLWYAIPRKLWTTLVVQELYHDCTIFCTVLVITMLSAVSTRLECSWTLRWPSRLCSFFAYCVIQYLSVFENTYFSFFSDFKKHDFYVFLSCCTRFLEHWISATSFSCSPFTCASFSLDLNVSCAGADLGVTRVTSHPSLVWQPISCYYYACD